MTDQELSEYLAQRARDMDCTALKNAAEKYKMAAKRLCVLAKIVRRCEECRANIPPHRRDVEIVDFIQYGREARQ